MIELHLAIYDGDVLRIKFNNKNELLDYLKELKSFDCIWLVTDDCEFGEILITQNLDTVINCFKKNMFSILDKLFVQEYQTYEDAYKVALGMRESNPKCYN
jgi:hypothetical protein